MRLLSFGRMAPVLLAGLVVTLAPQVGSAQDEAKKVKFETYDQVEIHGTFYPGKNKDSAPILIVPNVGGTRSNEGLIELAKKLQGAGNAVLLFDYRGHGDSTNVDANFWNLNVNLNGIKGGNKAMNAIDKKLFVPAYYSMLVNDIAAAKMFLDRRNDAGECNSKKLIVIGVQDGATLAAMWLDSEYKRFKVSTYDPFTKVPVKWEASPEGRGTLALISVGGVSRVNNLGVNTFTWFQHLGKNKVPVLFLYGAEDSAAAGFAGKNLSALKGNVKTPDKFMLSKSIKTKETGIGLLKEKLGLADDYIVPYVENILKAKGNNDHVQSETEKNGYVWVFNANNPSSAVSAKAENEKCLQPLPVKQYGFQLP